MNPGQPGKTNNQDAVVHRAYDRGCIAVLCDGCGSQQHSGTGADLGANIIANVLAEHLSVWPVAELDWLTVTDDIVRALRAAVAVFVPQADPAAFASVVMERFLFTALVCIVDGDTAVVMAFGDGVVITDKDTHIIESPVRNTPPYLGYLLLNHTAYHTEELRPHLAFAEVRTVALSRLTHGLIVGTDGLQGLLEADLHHPTLVQTSALQRWLNVEATERFVEGGFVAGKCQDDVSLVIVRTEAAQQRLLEQQERRVAKRSKQEIARLQAQVARLTEERDAAEDALRAAEDRVRTFSAILQPFSQAVPAFGRLIWGDQPEELEASHPSDPSARAPHSFGGGVPRAWKRG